MTRRIALLIFPDFQLLDAAGPISAFEIAERYVPGTYELSLVSVAPGPVPSSSGVALVAGELPDGAFDTVMVAGGEGTRPAALDPVLIAWVRDAAAQARRTARI